MIDWEEMDRESVKYFARGFIRPRIDPARIPPPFEYSPELLRPSRDYYIRVEA